MVTWQLGGEGAGVWAIRQAYEPDLSGQEPRFGALCTHAASPPAPRQRASEKGHSQRLFRVVKASMIRNHRAAPPIERIETPTVVHIPPQQPNVQYEFQNVHRIGAVRLSCLWRYRLSSCHATAICEAARPRRPAVAVTITVAAIIATPCLTALVSTRFPSQLLRHNIVVT